MENPDGGKIDVEWSTLLQLIVKVVDSHAGRHPGIIAEAVVEQIAAAYVLTPREQQHREQRKNHQERIRRLTHDVYRILADTQDIEPGREIAVRVLRSFLLTRRPPAETARPGRP